jgi:tyrosyl-tRNA synthetase
MRDYFVLLTDVPMQEFNSLISSDPYRAKQRLAYEVTLRCHPEIKDAINDFARVFAEEVIRTHSAKHSVLAQKAVISKSDLKVGKIWIVRLVKATGFVKSNSQARQKIIEGAVTLNGEKITDPDAELSVKEGDIVKVGKKRLAVVKIETADKHG